MVAMRYYTFPGALLLVTAILIISSNGAMAAEVAEDIMEVVTVNDADVAAASGNAEARGGGIGLPFPWWPLRFCLWNVTTTAVWQVTLTGTNIQCSTATGTALANLARQAATTGPLRALLGTGVTISPALCVVTGRQATYTIRLEASRTAMTRVRQNTATPVMQNIFNRAAVTRALGLGTYVLHLTALHYEHGSIRCGRIYHGGQL